MLSQGRKKGLAEKYDSYKKELEQLQDKFKLEFENIASRILKQNTEDFSNHNQKSIKEALGPLKMKIEAFEKTVGETYDKD